MKKTKLEGYKKECPICGKEFIYLNRRQLEFNYDTHLGACKRKQKKGESEK